MIKEKKIKNKQTLLATVSSILVFIIIQFSGSYHENSDSITKNEIEKLSKNQINLNANQLLSRNSTKENNHEIINKNELDDTKKELLINLVIDSFMVQVERALEQIKREPESIKLSNYKYFLKYKDNIIFTEEQRKKINLVVHLIEEYIYSNGVVNSDETENNQKFNRNKKIEIKENVL